VTRGRIGVSHRPWKEKKNARGSIAVTPENAQQKDKRREPWTLRQFNQKARPCGIDWGNLRLGPAELSDNPAHRGEQSRKKDKLPTRQTNRGDIGVGEIVTRPTKTPGVPEEGGKTKD